MKSKLLIFLVSVFCLVGGFYFVQGQTIGSTSKWRWLTGNYIEPIQVSGSYATPSSTAYCLGGDCITEWSTAAGSNWQATTTSKTGATLVGSTPWIAPTSTSSVYLPQDLEVSGNATTTGYISVGSLLKFTEISTPNAPGANELLVYSRDEGGDTGIYALTSAGETLLGGAGSAGCTDLGCLDDVVDSPAYTSGYALLGNGSAFVSRAIVEADISDLQSYALSSALTSHTGDSTIHFTQASISITESQISDLQSYALASALTSHTGNTSNPHSVTASQVGAMDLVSDQTVTTGIKNFAQPPLSPQNATTSSQVVNFGQFSAALQGLGSFKQAELATTGNTTLSGTQTVDGVMLGEDDNGIRILVWQQTDPTENGIYIFVFDDTWTRAEDFDSDAEIVGGTAVSVVGSGTAYPSSLFVQTEDSPELGTDPLVFVELPAPAPITASNGLVFSGSDVQINEAANRPVYINGSDELDFRHNNSVAVDATGNLYVTTSTVPFIWGQVGTFNAGLIANAATSTKLTVGASNPTGNNALFVTGGSYLNGNATTTGFFYVGAASSEVAIFNPSQAIAQIGDIESIGEGNYLEINGQTGLSSLTGNFSVSGNATTTGRHVIGGNPTNNFGKLFVLGDWYTSGNATTTGSLHTNDLFVVGQAGSDGCATFTSGRLTSTGTACGTGSGGGGSATTTSRIYFVSTGASNQTWSNMPAAETVLFGSNFSVQRVDLTSAVDYRIVVDQAVAGQSTADIRLQYTTDSTCSASWTNADDSGTELAIGTGTGVKQTSYVDFSAGAKDNVCLRLLGKQGNGTTDPAFRSIIVETRESVGGGGGTPGGNDRELQFNDNGTFAGAPLEYTIDGTDALITHTTAVVGTDAPSISIGGLFAEDGSDSADAAYFSITSAVLDNTGNVAKGGNISSDLGSLQVDTASDYGALDGGNFSFESGNVNDNSGQADGADFTLIGGAYTGGNWVGGNVEITAGDGDDVNGSILLTGNTVLTGNATTTGKLVVDGTPTVNNYSLFVASSNILGADSYGAYISNSESTGGSATYGIYGKATGVTGGTSYGLFGETTGLNTTNYGVYGKAHAPDATETNYGVYGTVTSGTGTSYGVYGTNGSNFGALGYHIAGGTSYGIYSSGDAFVSGQLFVDDNSNTSAVRIYGAVATAEIADLYLGAAGNMLFDLTPGNDTDQYFDFRSEDNQYSMIIRESDGTGAGAYGNLYVVDGTPDYMTITVTSATDGDALTITSDNTVGIGDNTPTGKLQVTGDEVRIGAAGTVNVATGDGDLFIADVLEVDGSVFLGSDSSDTVTVSVATISQGTADGSICMVSSVLKFVSGADCFGGLASPFLIDTDGVVLSEVLANQWKVESNSVNKIDNYNATKQARWLLSNVKEKDGQKEVDHLDSITVNLRCTEKGVTTIKRNYPLKSAYILDKDYGNLVEAATTKDGKYITTVQGETLLLEFVQPTKDDEALCGGQILYTFDAYGYYDYDGIEMTEEKAKAFWEKYSWLKSVLELFNKLHI